MTYCAVLEGDSHFGPNKRACLYVDANGRPAIYPSPRIDRQTRRRNDLKDMSLPEIQALWGAGSSKTNDCHSFELTEYYAGGWQQVHIDLAFENGKCRDFRVVGPHIAVSGWMPTANIPEFCPLQTSLKIFCV